MTSRDKENTTPEIEDSLNAAQVLFTANPAFLAPEALRYWQMQDCITEEIGKFSSAWIQRRHDATRAMIETGRRIATEGSSDPAGALQAVADWQTHAMQRIAEDAKDCTEMMTRCADALVRTEARTIRETADTLQKANKN